MTPVGTFRLLLAICCFLQGLQQAATSPLGDGPKAAAVECNLDPAVISEIQGYQTDVDQIIDFVFNGAFKGRTYQALVELADSFGGRISGSGELEAAIDWMVNLLITEGLENVHTEDVAVPHWVRNSESASMVLPRLQELHIVSLGGSTSTPPEGIRAEVLVVTDIDDLTQNAAQAAGRIVVFNLNYTNYFDLADYRIYGSSEASKVGALASMVSSLADFSLNTPHTGIQFPEEGVPLIPAVAISREDAAMLGRIQERGQKIEIQLTVGAKMYPDFISRNTIAEFQGSELPDEVVAVAGHIDAWDNGQGVMDDGGGSMISVFAPMVLKQLDLRPRRTVRTILFTAEEQGVIGGKGYYNNHLNESSQYQLMIESDFGTFTPLGLTFAGSDEAFCILQEVVKLLTPIGADQIEDVPAVAPDFEPWMETGVPIGSLYTANEKYFWYHHSEGDTVMVADPDTLDRCLAVWTAVAYVTADMTIRIPPSFV